MNSSSTNNPGNSPGSRVYYGWIIVGILFAVSTMLFGISYSYGVFFKSIEAQFGWNRVMTSSVFSAYMAVYSLTAIIGGWVLDRYGSRIVISVMGVFTGLSLILSSQVTQPWQLFVFYSLLLGIGTGPSYTVITATLTRWFGKRRGLALGIATCGNSMGLFIIAPVAGYLISIYSWQISYLILGLASLVIILPLAQFLRKSPSETGARLGALESEELASVSSSVPGVKSGWGVRAFRTGEFWMIFAMWLLFSMCLFTVTTHTVPYAIDTGMTPVQAATVLSTIGVVSVIGRVAVGRISDRADKRKVIAVCSLVLGGSMLWFGFATEMWMFYVFGIAMGFSYGGLGPPITAIVGDFFGMRNIGSIIGMLELGWGAGAAAGPAMAGYIFDVNRHYTLAFIILAGAMFILTLLAFVMKPKPKAKPL